MKFSEMGISTNTTSALEKMGYLEATEVQEKAIPTLLEGKDIIVRSQTGTGKTAAFGIGAIENIAKDKSKKCLVLAPTRELALQLTKELRAIALFHRQKIYTIYGGVDIDQQRSVLQRGYDIIIATPGRLLDHFRRNNLDLALFNLVILDEADKMFDMGFQEDIDEILANVSQYRQTILLSATLDPKIMDVAGRHMKTPEILEIGAIEKASTIEEQFIELGRKEKFGKLLDILNGESVSRVIVFVSTRASAEYIGKKLGLKSREVGFVHGGIGQSKRERIVDEFKQGKLKVLVATDVAARGIHVDGISHVINYDQSKDEDSHIHRIGRTGRMGEKGMAITFVEVEDIMYDPSKHSQDYQRRSSYSRGPSRPSHGNRNYSSNRSSHYANRGEPRGPAREGSVDRSSGEYKSSHKNNTRSFKPRTKRHWGSSSRY
ncbi:MAG: DEAD/DEAH box helicase [Candidatus Micrarchaeota archaeon]